MTVKFEQRALRLPGKNMIDEQETKYCKRIKRFLKEKTRQEVLTRQESSIAF